MTPYQEKRRAALERKVKDALAWAAKCEAEAPKWDAEAAKWAAEIPGWTAKRLTEADKWAALRGLLEARRKAETAAKLAKAARARVAAWKTRAELAAEELELWLERIEAKKVWMNSPEYRALRHKRRSARLERIEAEFVRKHRKPLTDNAIKN